MTTLRRPSPRCGRPIRASGSSSTTSCRPSRSLGSPGHVQGRRGQCLDGAHHDHRQRGGMMPGALCASRDARREPGYVTANLLFERKRGCPLPETDAGNRRPPTHSCQTGEVRQKTTAGMNTETHVKTSGRQGGGYGDGERGLEPARDRDLPRCSVEILRDLGLSTEKIVAYHRRFPTPTPASCWYRPPAS